MELRHFRGLPPRYDTRWGTEFWSFVREATAPGVSILDLGGGRQPTLAPGERPPGARYVGLDISASELLAAPPGSYDETFAAPIEDAVPGLTGSFDLIVSWQVLEHVDDMDRTAAVLHDYLRPGGRFVACLSGRNAVYAVANRLLPAGLSGRIVAHLRRRPLETVFRTRYHRCTYGGLQSAFGAWDHLRIVPLWHAADYFDRVPMLQQGYIRYENWAFAHNRRELATNYVIAADKRL
jgi:SAM-dependent methyltransferase